MQDRAPNGRQVAIVDLGTTNLTRFKHALTCLGYRPEVITSDSAIAEAPIAVVPASGALAPLMQHIRRSGISEGLTARVEAGLPTLAVDAGAHLFAEGFVEDKASGPGLGVLPGIVRSLPDQGVRGETLVNPHIGWNQAELVKASPLLKSSAIYYYAHRRVVDVGSQWEACVLAQSEHTLVFPALLSQGSLVATQFQPEMSGAEGLSFLARFFSEATPAP